MILFVSVRYSGASEVFWRLTS